jgi:ribonuclease P protein component
LIGRLGERREFERLTRDGRRARSATLWCRSLDDPTVVPPRVAFAIGRGVGAAVVRNRLRRRLRELVRAATAGDAPLLACGLVLLGARPEAAERSFVELGDEVTALLQAVTGDCHDRRGVPA